MSNDKSKQGGCGCQGHNQGRRDMMRSAMALALAPLAAAYGSAALAQAGGERSKRPEAGDRLAFMMGDRQGQKITPDDVQIGQEPVLAYPMNPTTGEVISARINMIALARLKPGDFGADTAPHVADGIVGYSALCTHYGCPVTGIHPSHTSIVCNCHGTVFDAANNGVVLSGPATRRLALLPLAIVDGDLVVAGRFNGPLGPPT